MSVIFGIVNFKSNPITHYLKEIASGCNFVNCEPVKFWSDKTAGLGTILRFSTPESKFEKTPLTINNLTITSYSRIDNREELYKILCIDDVKLNTVPDSYLILRAYKKWGDNCVNHIEGNWVFAIWDDVKKNLFVATDPIGNFGLYYYKSLDFFAFSSTIHGLLSIKEVSKEINPYYPLGLLNSWIPDNGLTVYKHISTQHPATFFNLKNAEIKKVRYWKIEETKPIYREELADYINDFINLYTKSVQLNLRYEGKTGSMLSGGLDSGSVSSLAAEQLLKKNQKLISFTSIPKYDVSKIVKASRFGNEELLAKATSDFSGNIEQYFIKGDKTSIIDGVKEFNSILKSPIYPACNAFWIYEILQTAKEKNISNLLIGQKGNATVSWSGLPKKQSFYYIFKHFKNKKISFLTLLKKLIKKVFFVKKKPKNSSVRKNNLTRLNNSSINELITLIKNSNKNKRNLSKTKSMALRCGMINPFHTNGIIWQELSYHFGFQINDPTANKKLIEFCLSIPDHFYRDMDNDRLLIKLAMKGKMPKTVLNNTLRGKQAADISFRVKDEFDDLKDIISESKQSFEMSNLIDLKKMEDFLDVLNKENIPPNHQEYAGSFMRALSITLFYKIYA